MRKQSARLSPLRNALIIVLGIVGGTLATVSTASPAGAVDNTESVDVGMPFAGKWADDNGVFSTPYNDVDASHPTAHAISVWGGNWATDLYAADGTDVRLHLSTPTGTPSFEHMTYGNGGCGSRVVFKVNIDSTLVGYLYYEHLKNVVTSTAQIYDGAVLGKVDQTCHVGYAHVHVEFKNATNYSCYYHKGNPGVSVSDGAVIGRLGSNNTANRQACMTRPEDPTTTDTDSDGLADNKDSCSTVAGVLWNSGCPEQPNQQQGDIDGDGYDDVVNLYDDGNSSIRFLVLRGQSNGTFAAPITAYQSCSGCWAWASTKFVVGHFNNDAYDDVMAFYDYGSTVVRFLLLPGQSNGTFGTPVESYYSSTWSWWSSKITVSNVNGDNYDDVVVLYDDGNSSIRFITLPGQSSGYLGTPVVSYQSCSGCWAWASTKFVVGHFNNDAYDDVMAMYNYGGTVIRVWLLPGQSNGTFGTPLESYYNATWSWGSSRLVASNVNGDNYDDVVVFYDDGNSNMRFITLPGQSSGYVSTPVVSYQSCSGCWAWASTKISAGNVNGDSYDDVVALYDYGGVVVRFWTLLGQSSGTFHSPTEAYYSASWTWASTRLS